MVAQASGSKMLQLYGNPRSRATRCLWMLDRSRGIGAYLGLVPRRYQSGEVDYTGGISKCGDRRIRTLLYEAANVMLTRYNGQLRLKDWAFARTGRFKSLREARLQWPSMAVRRRSQVTSAIKNVEHVCPPRSLHLLAAS